jgi:hypothetical protein
MFLGKVREFNITFLKKVGDSELCVSCCTTNSDRLGCGQAGEAEEREGEYGRRSMNLDHKLETEEDIPYGGAVRTCIRRCGEESCTGGGYLS